MFLKHQNAVSKWKRTQYIHTHFHTNVHTHVHVPMHMHILYISYVNTSTHIICFAHEYTISHTQLNRHTHTHIQKHSFFSWYSVFPSPPPSLAFLSIHHRTPGLHPALLWNQVLWFKVKAYFHPMSLKTNLKLWTFLQKSVLPEANSLQRKGKFLLIWGIKSGGKKKTCLKKQDSSVSLELGHPKPIVKTFGAPKTSSVWMVFA